MIVNVFWDETDSEFDSRKGHFVDVAAQSGLLISIDDIDRALLKIMEHQKENEGMDIVYIIQFWDDGEQTDEAYLDPGVDVKDVWDEIKAFARVNYH